MPHGRTYNMSSCLSFFNLPTVGKASFASQLETVVSRVHENYLEEGVE